MNLSAGRWVKVRTYDNAGNASPVVADPVKIDNTAPTLNITSPTIGSLSLHTGNNVKLQASTKDKQSGITKFKVFVDGNLVATKVHGPFSYPLKMR